MLINLSNSITLYPTHWNKNGKMSALKTALDARRDRLWLIRCSELNRQVRQGFSAAW